MKLELEIEKITVDPGIIEGQADTIQIHTKYPAAWTAYKAENLIIKILCNPGTYSQYIKEHFNIEIECEICGRK